MSPFYCPSPPGKKVGAACAWQRVRPRNRQSLSFFGFTPRVAGATAGLKRTFGQIRSFGQNAEAGHE